MLSLVAQVKNKVAHNASIFARMVLHMLNLSGHIPVVQDSTTIVQDEDIGSADVSMKDSTLLVRILVTCGWM